MSTYQYGALDPVKNIDVNGDSIWYSFNKNVITMHMTGKVINGSKDDINMKETVSDMIGDISDSFQGKFNIGNKEYTMASDIKLEAVSSMDEVGSSDHLIVLAHATGKGARGPTNEIGGKTIHVASSDYPEKGTVSGLFGLSNTRSLVHEVGHTAGLSHFTGFGSDNLMKQKVGGTDLSPGQLKSMFNHRGAINKGSNSTTNPYTGQRSPNSTIFDRNTRAIGSITNVGLRTK
jgi:hypothetical protein